MTGLADIENRVAELETGRMDPAEAIREANAIAEAVVALTRQRTASEDPPEQVLEDVAEAAEQARLGYEAVRGRYDHDPEVGEALTLIAGYWAMRRSAAATEAEVVRGRQTALAAATGAGPAEDPFAARPKVAPTSPLVADVAKAAGGFAPLFSAMELTAKPDRASTQTPAAELLAMAVAKRADAGLGHLSGLGAGTMPERASGEDGTERSRSLGDLTSKLGAAPPHAVPTAKPDQLDRIRRLRAPGGPPPASRKEPGDGG